MVKIIERTVYKNDKTIESKTHKIEIPGEINGGTMLSAVMNLDGWYLVMKDRENNICIIIEGNNEADLLSLENLFKQMTASITILTPLNLPDNFLDTND